MSSNVPKGPPPINYATHPRQLAQRAGDGSDAPRSLESQSATPSPSSNPFVGQDVLLASPQELTKSSASHATATSNTNMHRQGGTRITRPPQSATPSPSSNPFVGRDILLASPQQLSKSSTSHATPTSITNTNGRGGTGTTRFESLMDGLAEDLAMAGISQQPQPASVEAPVSPRSVPRRSNKKYYSVVVGRCCGVFTQWSIVKTLIDRVPGGLATGFRTYDEAVEDYNRAKTRGFVRLVREPGDDLVFGPRSQGVM